MLEYLQSELGLAYRTRLTQHALQTYLDPPRGPSGANAGRTASEKDTEADNAVSVDPHAVALEKGFIEMGVNKGEQLFYKLANLDDRIKNADQVSSPLLDEHWELRR